MSGNGRVVPEALTGQIMSAFAERAKSAENLSVSDVPLGQRCPHHCPEQCPHPRASSAQAPDNALGAPMTIRQVSQLLGCSEWTIRQQYLPKGLPHFRLSPRGKLLFFHNQIVRWVLDRQRQKGGIYK